MKLPNTWTYDILNTVVQIAFFGPLLFAIVYGTLFNWWKSVTGWTMMINSLALSGATLHAVLLVWGLGHVHVDHHGLLSVRLGTPGWETALSWLTVLCVATLGISCMVLTWECLRNFHSYSRSKLVNRVLHLTNELGEMESHGTIEEQR